MGIILLKEKNEFLVPLKAVYCITQSGNDKTTDKIKGWEYRSLRNIISLVRYRDQLEGGTSCKCDRFVPWKKIGNATNSI